MNKNRKSLIFFRIDTCRIFEIITTVIDKTKFLFCCQGNNGLELHYTEDKDPLPGQLHHYQVTLDEVIVILLTQPKPVVYLHQKLFGEE